MPKSKKQTSQSRGPFGLSIPEAGAMIGLGQRLIWKCASCGKRRGRPGEQTIKSIEQFIRRYGWTWRPLIMCDDGAIRVW
jgi:hypothetical protein